MCARTAVICALYELDVSLVLIDLLLPLQEKLRWLGYMVAFCMTLGS